MEAFLHQRETHPRRLLLFPDPLQLSASNLLGNAGTLLPLLDPLRQDLIDATERQRRGVKEPTDFRNMYWFWETKLHQVNRQCHVCFLHKFEVLGETPEYTVIRCTRHLIHSTRSAGTNHILVPSRVVVHNFGGFYHQSFYHRISDYTARRCCNSFMKLWRKPWRKKSWQFLPYWFNFSSIRDDAEVFSE